MMTRCVVAQDNSGTIDFREFVIGLHVIASPANTEETLQLAFQVSLSSALVAPFLL